MASRLTRLTRLARQPLSLPQHHLPTPPISPLLLTIRHASNSNSPSPNPFQTMPAPPRLPTDQQAEFEQLQRTANTQSGFNPTSTPDFSSSSSSPTATTAASSETTATIKEGEEFTPMPLRKGAPPEFEGEVNPKTGEVGGPKNEPLRWGAAGDYSFNGRVTDF
ncbi:DUF1674-domain-containing protein [Hypoxylon fragiforme]|uniref:DUF1674-domain-containing protein n=1 Tax=Hypoxylon fragiforme TaxID=63214 RepID=UPI0020C656CA|nr:DUF1674-domain-containing protein [Hypoxylon fragiforme]KAI2611360.1 DUF1674-domain-containing protein [Hypoxylon fragiforme]